MTGSKGIARSASGATRSMYVSRTGSGGMGTPRGQYSERELMAVRGEDSTPAPVPRRLVMSMSWLCSAAYEPLSGPPTPRLPSSSATHYMQPFTHNIVLRVQFPDCGPLCDRACMQCYQRRHFRYPVTQAILPMHCSLLQRAYRYPQICFIALLDEKLFHHLRPSHSKMKLQGN
jgi:hypothetical protein